MLTIDIPSSNARQSEEDCFAKYILEGIKKNGEKTFLWYGQGYSNSWEDGYSDGAGEKRVDCSRLAIVRVIEEFRNKGYSIIHGNTIAAGKYITIKG